MTFYNVISGILFVLTWQVFLASLWGPRTLPAAALLTLIFNEVVNTSETMERDPDKAPTYTNWMKLTDLGCFIALSVALTAVDVTHSVWKLKDDQLALPFAVAPWMFWGLLLLYVLGLLLWNYLAEVWLIAGYTTKMWRFPWSLAGLYFVGSAGSSYFESEDLGPWSQAIAAVSVAVVIVYMCVKAVRLHKEPRKA